MINDSEMHKHFLWATKKIIAMVESMSEDQFNQKLKIDSRSVREIILHLVSIYAYFSSQPDYKTIVAQSKLMNKKALLNLQGELSMKVITILETNPDKVIPVKTQQGVVKNITGFSLFHMLSDHFAYHRGQIVTMYKEITNKEGIGTDYAQYLTEDNPDIELVKEKV